ncbi:MAG: hypothetical protein WC184_12360 [Acidimicrobiia bacterium]
MWSFQGNSDSRTTKRYKGLTILEVILSLLVGLALIVVAFVGYSRVVNRAQNDLELLALKTVAREAQTLLAFSGDETWVTQTGLQAVLEAIEDWSVNTDLDSPFVDSFVVPVENNQWPTVGEIGFIRSPTTLVLVKASEHGWCVITAPPRGVIYGGCLDSETIENEKLTPISAVENGAVPGVPPTDLAGHTLENIPTNPQLKWASIAAGTLHSCGLDTNGGVWCWGRNQQGQLGVNKPGVQNELVPTPVAGNHVFTSITTHSFHSCAIDTEGKAWCWGQGSNYRLGTGNETNQLVPTPVAGNHTFTNVTNAQFHSCAIDTEDKAWCWGYNGTGQLGNGNTATQSVPTPVAGNRSYTTISAGSTTVCALDTNGKAWCWGANTSGEAGVGDTSPRYIPTAVTTNRTFTAISTGEAHSCAIDTVGKAWCWGWNNTGGVGVAGSGYKHTPIEVVSNETFTAITTNLYHSCGLTTENTVLCWGNNGNGQLGDNTTANRHTPAPVLLTAPVNKISAGFYHSCAIDTSGGLWCWGAGSAGALGNGGTVDIPYPTQIINTN